MKRFFTFKHQVEDREINLEIEAASKRQAVKVLKLLVQEPEKWVLIETSDVRESHLTVEMIEKMLP